MAKLLMKQDYITDQIRSRFPKCINGRYIGLEFEYPVVSVDGSAIQYEVIEILWQKLSEKGWTLQKDGMTQKWVSAIKENETCTHTYRTDTITTDVGYSILEVALAPFESLPKAEVRLREILQIITSILDQCDAVLIGYGVQPVEVPNSQLLAPKGRYHILSKDGIEYAKKNIDYPFMLSAASHTHINISRSEAIGAVNALNATSGLRIALFANSPIWNNTLSEVKAMRELFYDLWFTHRRSQIGIPPRIGDFDQYVQYILDFRRLMIKRDDSYLMLNNKLPFRTFISGDTNQSATAPSGEQVSVTLGIDDVIFQFGFAYFNTRLQPRYGTVEDRSACQQPPSACLAPSALTLGLINNLSSTEEFANDLSLDQWRDLRILACRNGLNIEYPDFNVHAVIRQMLDVARNGLAQRNLGEEHYLDELYERLERKRCPADDVCDWYTLGGIQNIVEMCDMKAFLNDKRQ